MHQQMLAAKIIESANNNFFLLSKMYSSYLLGNLNPLVEINQLD